MLSQKDGPLTWQPLHPMTQPLQLRGYLAIPTLLQMRFLRRDLVVQSRERKRVGGVHVVVLARIFQSG